MISKELLSEIFMYKVTQIHNIDAENNIHFNGGNEARYPYFLIKPITINIYQLAHKCKEWAFNKGGIDITSGKRIGLDGWECLVFIGVIPCNCYEAETEPQAIFKACQWILENR